MTDINPYDALGVEPDATTEEIKRAYRSKAKTAHPDAGGTEEEFHTLSTALAVLTDPKRRKNFDDTGKIDEVEDTDGNAMSIIAGLIGDFVDDEDAKFNDLVAAMKEEVLRRQREAEAAIEKMHKDEKRIKDLNERFTAKGRNRIAPLFARALSRLIDQISAARQTVADLKRAVEILDEHSFRVEEETDIELNEDDLSELRRQLAAAQAKVFSHGNWSF